MSKQPEYPDPANKAIYIVKKHQALWKDEAKIREMAIKEAVRFRNQILTPEGRDFWALVISHIKSILP